ncbi:MAG: hypothetical protein MZW92_31175 [Comamonadaceae bacterium]|nr:hypothetical protein [Comamonadaceae bacterium]
MSRPDLKILVNMTVQDEMREDVPRFIDFWLPLADEVSVSPCRPIGTRDNILVREAPPIERILLHAVHDARRLLGQETSDSAAKTGSTTEMWGR